MRSYEKRYEEDGSYNLWEYKTVWKQTIEDDSYNYWVGKGAVVTDIPYIIPTPITLEELKLSKLQEIKYAYTNSRTRGNGNKVTTSILDNDIAIVMDADDESYTDLKCLVEDLWNDDVLVMDNIRDFGNVDHSFTKDQVKIMIKEIAVNGLENKIKKRTLQALAESATCKEDLDSILW